MQLNKYIDHTLLKPEATSAQIKKLCQEALEFDFATVCVNPTHIKYAKELLSNSNVGVTTVIGFPLGANTTETKVFELQHALKDGADEFDFVVNIGDAKDGNFDKILTEFRQLRQVTNKVIKVILETVFLTEDEITKLCELAVEAKLDFVKTSTGFASQGATIENVKLMKSVVKQNAKVKAAGGVRSYEDAKAMIEAGADRLGTSGGVTIIQGGKLDKNQY